MRTLLVLPLALLLACPDPGKETGDDECGDSAPAPWFADADGDGFGNPDETASDCIQPDGYVGDDSDCDDTDATINPSATEDCDAATDLNCDGDPSAGAIDALTFYADADGDSFGDPDAPITACEAGAGVVADATDCDDIDATAFPGARESCDEVDSDCDGAFDDPDAVDPSIFFADSDGDGYGDAFVIAWACDAPDGYTDNADDCNDTEPLVHPRALELCNDVDDDCNGQVDDDAEDKFALYEDLDGDGYGDPTVAQSSCDELDGWSRDRTDCDPTRADTYPGAPDGCDGLDKDCDGEVDEADSVGAPTWYADADGDGWGSDTATAIACDAPADHLAAAGDCDDGDAASSPDALEVCGGGDENCDGSVDETSASDATIWYVDLDADGFGDPLGAIFGCTQPAGHVADATDCLDADPDANPDGVDVCADAVDQDCDGDADDGCWPTGTVLAADAATVLEGTTSNQQFGYWLSGGGDLTGDGVPDLVSLEGGSSHATLYVLDAATSGTSLVPSAGVLATRTAPSGTLTTPWTADLDGDGSFDLLASSTDQGKTYLEYGPIAGSGSLGSDFRTAQLASAAFGDLDDDGVDDLVGSSVATGAVYVFASPTGSVSVGSATATITDTSGASYFGRSLASGEDLDGDGVDDLAVGSLDGNAVYVFAGPLSGATTSASADTTISASASTDPYFGAFGVSISPDTNGDGYAELAAGNQVEWVAGTIFGELFLFEGSLLGVVSPADAFASIAADATLVAAGAGSTAADVDGDGVADVVFSSVGPGFDADIGIFFGPLSGAYVGADADTVIDCTGTDAGFASGVVNTGDLAGLGYDGIAFGGARDSATTNAGAAWVFYGP